MLVFLGYVCSPILFNFVRSIRRTTIDIPAPAIGYSSDADMLESNMIHLGIICSFTAPFLVTHIIQMEEHRWTNIDDDIKSFADFLYGLQFIQVVIAFYVSFMPYHLFWGPDTPYKFNQYCGYGHVGLTVSLFYLFPAITLLWYLLARCTTNVNDTFLGVYFAFNSIYSIPLVSWYDEMIHCLIFDIVDQHKANIKMDHDDIAGLDEWLKREDTPHTREELKTVANQERMNDEVYFISGYKTRVRFMGTGPLRF